MTQAFNKVQLEESMPGDVTEQVAQTDARVLVSWAYMQEALHFRDEAGWY